MEQLNLDDRPSSLEFSAEDLDKMLSIALYGGTTYYKPIRAITIKHILHNTIGNDNPYMDVSNKELNTLIGKLRRRFLGTRNKAIEVGEGTKRIIYDDYFDNSFDFLMATSRAYKNKSLSGLYCDDNIQDVMRALNEYITPNKSELFAAFPDIKVLMVNYNTPDRVSVSAIKVCNFLFRFCARAYGFYSSLNSDLLIKPKYAGSPEISRELIEHSTHSSDFTDRLMKFILRSIIGINSVDACVQELLNLFLE